MWLLVTQLNKAQIPWQDMDRKPFTDIPAFSLVLSSFLLTTLASSHTKHSPTYHLWICLCYSLFLEWPFPTHVCLWPIPSHLKFNLFYIVSPQTLPPHPMIVSLHVLNFLDTLLLSWPLSSGIIQFVCLTGLWSPRGRGHILFIVVVMFSRTLPGN